MWSAYKVLSMLCPLTQWRPAFGRWLRSGGSVALAGLSLLSGGVAGAQTADHIEMSAKQWTTTATVTFLPSVDGVGPVMAAPSGSRAILRDLEFTDGTIEYDVRPKNGSIAGLKFRSVEQQTADAFYLRAKPDCDRSPSCIQYMPYHHGAYEWDLYPEYQTHAPIRADEWNHIKLVISGHRLNAYVNGAAEPVLRVGGLEGGAAKGGISVSGPADYANLTISKDVAELPSDATFDPTDHDPNFVRTWQASTPVIIPTINDTTYQVPTGVAPQLAQMPPSGAAWTTIQAERKGLIDLSRAFGSSKDGAVVSLVWLKTTISSTRPQVKPVSMGWVREAWVFVNGRLIFADRNLYGTAASKAPDGSMSLQNGAFKLPLKKGNNTLVVALDDNFSGGQHFGWGMQFHLNEASGVRFR